MHRNSLALIICTFLLIKTHAVEASQSVGFGAQYGGLIGISNSYPTDNGSLRWGVGVIGVAAGYDLSLTSKVSLGAQLLYNFIGKGAGLNLNYHFTSISGSGWMIGWDVYAAQSELSSESRRNNYNTFTFISVGYKY